MFKQYMKGKFTGWLLMVSLAALLSGCAGCPGENDAGGMFYGRWVDQAIQLNYLEIERDGTFVMGAGPVPIHTGIWQMVDNEISFKLEVPGMEEIVFAGGRIEGNRLILHTVGPGGTVGGPGSVEMIYVRR